MKDNLTFVVCGLIHWESQFALQFPFRKISGSYRPRSSPFYLFYKTMLSYEKIGEGSP